MLSHIRSALVLLMHLKGIQFQVTSKNISVTAPCRCSWQPIETTNCYYSFIISFKGKQLKQINISLYIYFSIYFKLIKTTGLLCSLNESSFRMLFRSRKEQIMHLFHLFQQFHCFQYTIQKWGEDGTFLVLIILR